MVIKLGNCSLEVARLFLCFKKDPEMNRKSATSKKHSEHVLIA